MSIDRHAEVVEEWFWQANADNQPISLQVKNFNEEYNEYLTAKEKGDRVGMFDGVVDMYWVLLGIINTVRSMAFRHDFPLDEGFTEVARSNYSKFKPLGEGRFEVLKREDGKILKHPETYFPPDLTKVLEENETTKQ